MLKAKRLLLLFVTFTCTLFASAYDAFIGGVYYNITNKNLHHAEVTNKAGDSSDTSYTGAITILNTFYHDGVEYTVTEIKEYAFFNCSKLTSITIPNSVTSIGANAFQNCSGLTTISIPSSVKIIGEYAFCGCSGLTSVNISNSTTYVCAHAFDECPLLPNITIGSREVRNSTFSFIFIPNTQKDPLPKIDLDSFYFFAKANKEFYANDVVSAEDIIFPYHYMMDKHAYECIVNGSSVAIAQELLSFPSYYQRMLLIYRGDNGYEVRKKYAVHADSLYCLHKRDSLEKIREVDLYFNKLERDNENKYIQNIKKNKLFLKNIQYSSGLGDQCGMKTDIYNCFDKKIKYIYLNYTPYNAVGDVQVDALGKKTATCRGIGPLEPGNSTSWDFNDIFVNRHGVIAKINLTSVKFEFFDGSTLIYNGYSNILKHKYVNYEPLMISEFDLENKRKEYLRNIGNFDLLSKNEEERLVDALRECERINSNSSKLLKLPVYPGGDEALYKFLQDNISYPESLTKGGTFNVKVSLSVDIDGSVKIFRIQDSPNEECTSIIKRTIEKMPNWNPAMVGNLPERYMLNLPIRFRIQY